ncbi:hypothetical protein FB567DRAFT_629591 [Paraphoma chrysanthemicola]|uniref:Uncharacterized protein n=1 Tax=Paraphoma chrysanthemicola TaxID=798071 RepID=A0A8K0R625_9PLEO|nr:hypothetical protein FB567DRAFT_629591 [Paraphoma chrysanthemicola]
MYPIVKSSMVIDPAELIIPPFNPNRIRPARAETPSPPLEAYATPPSHSRSIASSISTPPPSYSMLPPDAPPTPPSPSPSRDPPPPEVAPIDSISNAEVPAHIAFASATPQNRLDHAPTENSTPPRSLTPPRTPSWSDLRAATAPQLSTALALYSPTRKIYASKQVFLDKGFEGLVSNQHIAVKDTCPICQGVLSWTNPADDHVIPPARRNKSCGCIYHASCIERFIREGKYDRCPGYGLKHWATGARRVWLECKDGWKRLCEHTTYPGGQSDRGNTRPPTTHSGA